MLKELLISLGLTLALEGLYGLLWGLKGRRNWLLLGLVNVVTNPVAVVLYRLVSRSWVFVAVLECAVVLAEWRAYRAWSKEGRTGFVFALCANCFSFFGGLLLNYLI